MIAPRASALVFRSVRAQELRLYSAFLWALVLVMAGLVVAGIAEWLDRGDEPLTMILALAALLLAAVLVDRRRRRQVARITRTPQGLVVETAGLLRPRRIEVPVAALPLLRVTEPDLSGTMTLRIPGAGPALRLDTGPVMPELGLPAPPARPGKRR